MYAIQKNTLTEIADAIKEKTGKTDKLNPEEMPEEIRSISEGVELPELINEGTSSDLLSGKQLIDQEGNIVTGAIAFQPAKTITPSTTSQIAVSSGYYTGGNVTVAGDSNLVASNIKSGVSIFGVSGTAIDGQEVEDKFIQGNFNIYNYEIDRVTTVGPGAFEFTGVKTATLNNVEQIQNGAFCNCYNLASINSPVATAIYTNAFSGCTKLTSVSFPICTTIGTNAFRGCTELTSVSFPICTAINANAFSGCTKLISVSFPICTTIGVYAFSNCTKLTSVSFPICTTIGTGAFTYCPELTSVSFPTAMTIDSAAFYSCYNLKSLYLTGLSVCALQNSNAFTSTPIGGFGSCGSIYIPASLLTNYQTATNWTYFSNRFVPLTGTINFLNVPVKKNIQINTTYKISIPIIILNNDDSLSPTVVVSSSDESIVDVLNVVVANNNISFDMNSTNITGNAEISITASLNEEMVTKTFTVEVHEIIYRTYSIEDDGNTYTFVLNSNDYYESNNKEIQNSFAMCKVNVEVSAESTMYLDCINYAESNFDYGILSKLDCTLNKSNHADTVNVYHSFKGSSISSVQTVSYVIPEGQHYIYIKYIKDSSQNSNNDSLQFKVRFE